MTSWGYNTSTAVTQFAIGKLRYYRETVIYNKYISINQSMYLPIVKNTLQINPFSQWAEKDCLLKMKTI